MRSNKITSINIHTSSFVKRQPKEFLLSKIVFLSLTYLIDRSINMILFIFDKFYLKFIRNRMNLPEITKYHGLFQKVFFIKTVHQKYMKNEVNKCNDNSKKVLLSIDYINSK